MSRTALYRHFDAAGRLLYVGISNDALRRLCQHKDRSGWYAQVARVEMEWLPTRPDALQAEARAIAAERPVWNKQRPRPTAVRTANVPREPVCSPGFAVLHRASGRLDGWYRRREQAEHLVGWFGAMFPKDYFELVDSSRWPTPPRIADSFWLRSAWHERWAASPPDFAAGDAFDRQAEVAA